MPAEQVGEAAAQVGNCRSLRGDVDGHGEVKPMSLQRLSQRQAFSHTMKSNREMRLLCSSRGMNSPGRSGRGGMLPAHQGLPRR